MKEAGDEKTKLTIAYVDWGPLEAFAVMIKDYLTKIMEVELVKWDIVVYQQKSREGKWDVYVMGRTRPTESIYCDEFFHSKAGGNFAGYENPELDRLIEKADIEQNPIKRKALYAEVEEILARNLPFLPAAVHNNAAIIRKNLEGVIPEAVTGIAKFCGTYFKE